MDASRIAQAFPGGAMPPPTTPMGPTSPLSGDFGALQQLGLQQGQQFLGSAPVSEETAARAAMIQKAQEAAQMPLPQTGIQMGPWGATPQHSALHNTAINLLKGIGLGLEGTKPGAAVAQAYFRPGEQQYAMKQHGIAEQIKALQEQAQGAGTEAGQLAGIEARPLYGMGSAVGRIGAAQLSAQAAHERTQAIVQRTSLQHEAEMARIAAMKDINQKNNAAKITVRQMEDETMTQIKSMGDLTNEEVQTMRNNAAFELLNTKGAQDPSIKAAIMETFFGMPTAQAPGGPAPAMAPVTQGRPAAPTGAEPQRPANVPADYKYNAKGPKGPGWYKPKGKANAPAAR